MAEFFIFCEKWNWVTQGQGISIFFSPSISSSSTTPTEANLFEKETGLQRKREQEGN